MKSYYIEYLSQLLTITTKSLNAALELLNEGNTVPFISRYRKERTGNLDEVVLFDIENHLNRYNDLEQRKDTILRSIEEQGSLTEELRQKIENEIEMVRLEDIYLPFKPRKRTKAQIAREKGLEPLADVLLRQTNDDPEFLAKAYVGDLVSDIEEALIGARDIIAEKVNEDAGIRDILRQVFIRKAQIRSKVVKGKEQEAVTYRDYFDFSEAIKNCKSHRLMAMLRGERENLLRVHVVVELEEMEEIVERRYIRNRNKTAEQVKMAISDSCKRLLLPSMESETIKYYKEIADLEAIKVFASNLRQLLMLPPAGEKRILGIDPGFRTGCKVVCLDEFGNLLHHETIYPHPPKSEEVASARKIHTLIEAYRIEMIAIGNGTASRETERFISSLRFREDVKVFVVDESGASIYSASKVARDEFPEFDVTVRGSVSIARRLSDPLAELIKIDPKSIGVGQYQHDVNQVKLKTELDQVVVSCVNKVGVNLNTASTQLLSYVSGLGPSIAANIVLYRKENGAFRQRKELNKVPRLGAKAFQQSAGFLRIPGGENPLDNSAVHPENYNVVTEIAKKMKVTVDELIGNRKLLDQLSAKEFVNENCGELTFNDIVEELKKPGRDPRGEITSFQFDDRIRNIEDLIEGAILNGIVTNVTNFGVFVDIGIKQNGLVHISEISNTYIQNPADVVKLHQQVKVRILSVDIDRGRIQLSMRNCE